MILFSLLVTEHLLVCCACTYLLSLLTSGHAISPNLSYLVSPPIVQLLATKPNPSTITTSHAPNASLTSRFLVLPRQSLIQSLSSCTASCPIWIYPSGARRPAAARPSKPCQQCPNLALQPIILFPAIDSPLLIYARACLPAAFLPPLSPMPLRRPSSASIQAAGRPIACRANLYLFQQQSGM